MSETPFKPGPLTKRYAEMLAAGYEPGKTYGASPLCFCGRRPVVLVRVNGSMLAYRCDQHKETPRWLS